MSTDNPFPPANSVYVTDINQDVTEANLFDVFREAGPVTSIRLFRHNYTNKSLGSAYINFSDTDDAQKALDTMNFTPIQGRPCRLMRSRPDPTSYKDTKSNVFVKNLAAEITTKELHDEFEQFGEIISCKVATDDKGKSKLYGFVHFAKEEAAKAAVEQADKKVIGGSEVSVVIAQKTNEREKSILDSTFTSCFVGNISKEVSDEKFREYFAKFGELVACNLQKGDSRPTNIAFVEYKEHESAAKAVAEANDADGDDSVAAEKEKLLVTRLQTKQERFGKGQNGKGAAGKGKGKGKGAHRPGGGVLFAGGPRHVALPQVGGGLAMAGAMQPAPQPQPGVHMPAVQHPPYGGYTAGYGGGYSGAGGPAASLQGLGGAAGYGAAQQGYMAQPGGMPSYMPQQQQPAAAPGMHPFAGPMGGMGQQMMPQQGALPLPSRGMHGGMGVQPGMPPRRAAAPLPGMAGMAVGGGMAPPGAAAPPPPGPSPSAMGGSGIDPSVLASMTQEQQRGYLGEKLFMRVKEVGQPDNAAKVTGMILEAMDNAEIINLLDSPQLMQSKVQEAVQVLRNHSQN